MLGILHIGLLCLTFCYLFILNQAKDGEIMFLSKKARALMLAGVMLFSIIFSSLIIIIDSNHDCSIDDCKICQTIQICLVKLKSVDKDNSSSELPFISAIFFVLFCFSVICNDKFSTLVNQKIKLSN